MSVQVAASGRRGVGPGRLSPEELVPDATAGEGAVRPCGQSTGLAGHLAEALAAQGPAAGLELLEEKQQVW